MNNEQFVYWLSGFMSYFNENHNDKSALMLKTYLGAIRKVLLTVNNQKTIEFMLTDFEEK